MAEKDRKAPKWRLISVYLELVGDGVLGGLCS